MQVALTSRTSRPLANRTVKLHRLLPHLGPLVSHLPPVSVAVVRAEVAARLRRDRVSIALQPQLAVPSGHAPLDQWVAVHRPRVGRVAHPVHLVERDAYPLLDGVPHPLPWLVP